jgi:hypothetical protein
VLKVDIKKEVEEDRDQLEQKVRMYFYFFLPPQPNSVRMYFYFFLPPPPNLFPTKEIMHNPFLRPSKILRKMSGVTKKKKLIYAPILILFGGNVL